VTVTTALGPSGPRTQAQRRAASRRRLLDAAVQCLAELGYQGTTFPEVVRRAGLSNGALWRHFRSKTELMVAAGMHCEEKLLAAVDEVDLEGLARDQRLDRALDVVWGWVSDPSFHGLLELLCVARADAEVRSGLLGNDPRSGRLFFDALARLVGQELASAPGFERAARQLGLTLYGVALTDSMRTPAADLRLRSEVRHVLAALLELPAQRANDPARP